jgi:hypothetical protein
MTFDIAGQMLVVTIAASLLGIVISCLLAFLVLRSAILGALKAHTRWSRSGGA